YALFVENHITTVNDLYDDVWLEIFEFLYINDIFNSFWNINNNLNRIIVDRRLKLYANLIRDESLDYFNLTILPNIHSQQLISLKLTNCFEKQMNFNQYINLQSLTLNSINTMQLKLLLIAKHLTHLKYFQINAIGIFGQDNREIIEQILKIKTLKTCRFNFGLQKMGLRNETISAISSNIENFIIESEFVSNSLFKLIPHLPKPQYLNIYLREDYRYRSSITFNSLLNLKTLRLKISRLSFNHLKLLFDSVCSNLQILVLNGCIVNDLQYLLPQSWINIF
ncbi:unnamed protein product, partial [Didymodactylos carnosus]